MYIYLDKSRDLFKFVSVLLSASVESVGVSGMRDFFHVGPKLLIKLIEFISKKSSGQLQ